MSKFVAFILVYFAKMPGELFALSTRCSKTDHYLSIPYSKQTLHYIELFRLIPYSTSAFTKWRSSLCTTTTIVRVTLLPEQLLQNGVLVSLLLQLSYETHRILHSAKYESSDRRCKARARKTRSVGYTPTERVIRAQH